MFTNEMHLQYCGTLVKGKKKSKNAKLTQIQSAVTFEALGYFSKKRNR